MSKKLKRAYRWYNRRYFGNQLPNPPDVNIRWEDLGNAMMGYQLLDEIVLNRKDRLRTSVWRFTLLHEMLHLSLPDEPAHGKKFQAGMMRLAKAGAFRKLW
jgi:hypothetical protein